MAGKLTALEVKRSLPAEKVKKLSDGGGLQLLIKPNGKKYWRWAYRFAGKQKTLAIGTAEKVTLLEAREAAESARKLLKQGHDPVLMRQLVYDQNVNAANNTFEAVAWKVFERKKMPEGATGKIKGRWGGSHYSKQLSRLQNELLPWLAKRPITEIKSTELLSILRKIEARGHIETAHRVKSVAGEVFRFGVHEGLCERDITQDLKGALQTPDVVHFPSMTEPEQVGLLLNVLDGYGGTPQVRMALRLAPLTFVRPKELRHWRWAEIHWDESYWKLPKADTKMKEQDLIVPLCSQAINLLQELQLFTGDREYVFPNARHPRKPMSDGAVNSAMRRLGITSQEFCGHGFRAMARTMLDERLRVRPEIVEAQLGHSVKDANGRAYNRTAYLEDRAVMMQRWADYLDELRARAKGGNVVEIPPRPQIGVA